MKRILSSLFLFIVATNLLIAQATGKIVINKSTGGSIGSIVDSTTIISINQTTANQILTIPNLTSATAGKIIYINNTGTVPFIIFPGGLLSVGTGIVIRWDGSRWNINGNGNPIGATGPPGPAGATGATGATGPTGPAGGVNSVASTYSGLIISPTTGTVIANVDTTFLYTKTAAQIALNLKANLASPTFTGIPAAPTASPGTNTTQIATTAFVTAAVTGGSIPTLTNAHLFVGNGSNAATDVAVSGVLTLANTGAFSFASTTGSGATVQGTTPTFTTNITTPVILGGTAAGSNITYTSTTGTGTTGGIAHAFKGGTNGGTNLVTLLNDGSFIAGGVAQLSTENFSFQKNSNANNQFTVYNTTSGTAGKSTISALGAGNVGISLKALSAAFTTSGIDIQAASTLSSNSTAGLNIGTSSNTTMGIWTNNTQRANYGAGGGLFIGGSTTPTALLHLAAGTATANTGPLKFTSGTNLTTPEAGAVEFDGTNYFGTSSTTRYTLAKTLTATATLDFGSTAAGSESDLTITITGATLNDVVSIGVPNGSVTITGCYTAWVSATDTITIRFSNYGALTARDPASGTFRASIIKY